MHRAIFFIAQAFGLHIWVCNKNLLSGRSCKTNEHRLVCVARWEFRTFCMSRTRQIEFVQDKKESIVVEPKTISMWGQTVSSGHRRLTTRDLSAMIGVRFMKALCISPFGDHYVWPEYSYLKFWLLLVFGCFSVFNVHATNLALQIISCQCFCIISICNCPFRTTNF